MQNYSNQRIFELNQPQETIYKGEVMCPQHIITFSLSNDDSAALLFNLKYLPCSFVVFPAILLSGPKAICLDIDHFLCASCSRNHDTFSRLK